MSPRSEEFMDQARGRVEAERIVAGAADYVAAVEDMLDTEVQDHSKAS